jgi:RNA polymerase sigma-70 factor, ECF subfamily
LDELDTNARFEQAILPHLDAAYNLARWLTANDHDAQDVVQEACLRVFKFFGGFRGGNARSWLLTIVRNTSYTWLRQNRPHASATDATDELNCLEDTTTNPEMLMARSANTQAVRQALEQLPVEFRESIVLRELEGLSYKEIADVAGVPIGTVMSRLARGRKQLQQNLVRAAQVGDVQ